MLCNNRMARTSLPLSDVAGDGAGGTSEDPTARHGVWWVVRDIADVKGSVLLEHRQSTSYIIACEDASVALGD